MNKLVKLRNQIAEAYRLDQTDLAFELEEMYSDCEFELAKDNRGLQHYNHPNLSRITA